MKITTKQITTTAVLLAICIVSQFFKNTSVYITGPVINACLILAVLSVGIPCGIILSVITPVTSFFITGSPIIGAIPAIMPCIMAGNALLVLGAGIEFLAEAHDVQAMLTQGGTHRRGGVGGAGRDLQFDFGNFFFGHDVLSL